MTVFLFHGQEEFLIEKEIKKLKNELLDDSFLSVAYKIFDNPPFQTILECLQSPPLMFGNTLNLIYIDKYLLGNKLSIDDKQIESIDFALQALNPNINIIFVCKISRQETKKVDTRKKFYKTLSKYSQVKEFPQYRNYDKNLSGEIAKLAKEYELTLSSDNINLLVEQLGVNLTLINSELEKLKVAIYPKKTITTEEIKKYCSSAEDIFALSDLIIQGNKDEILKQYNLLTEKRHPLEIFSALQASFQRFIYIKNYEKINSPAELSLKLKLHEFVIKKIQEKLRKTSLERLIEIKGNLTSAEYKIKSGMNSDNKTVLELVLLN